MRHFSRPFLVFFALLIAAPLFISSDLAMSENGTEISEVGSRIETNIEIEGTGQFSCLTSDSDPASIVKTTSKGTLILTVDRALRLVKRNIRKLGKQIRKLTEKVRGADGSKKKKLKKRRGKKKEARTQRRAELEGIKACEDGTLAEGGVVESPTPTESVTLTPTPSQSPSPVATTAVTPSPNASASSSPSQSPSTSPSASPSASPSMSPSVSPSASPSASASSSPSTSPSISPSASPSSSPTNCQEAPADSPFNNPLNIPLDNTVSVLDFVSFPGGDVQDKVNYSVTGMNPNPSLPGGQARLVISVSCFGTNTEEIEIFTGGQTFSCGQTVVDRTVTADSDTGTITLTAVGGSCTYVQWVLTGTATRLN